MNKTYCGKRYGIVEYGTGFLIGFVLGYMAAVVIYGILVVNLIAALIAGMVMSKVYVNILIAKRQKEFTFEFCDYLDAISSSLSCGKNTFEAFLIANDDMQGLYPSNSPICIEGQRVANGLKSGRGIDELLKSMQERTGSEDVAIFADVYGICNLAGGDLRKTVNDTKLTIVEKINIENEIKTCLAAPKNELNIMAMMPIAITGALRVLGDSLVGKSSFLVNTIAVAIFVGAYVLGLKFVKIEV